LCFYFPDLKTCIFDGKIPAPGTPPSIVPRFAVGAPVKVNVGDWLPGRVVMHWYRELYWETGKFVPYQVKCDGAEGPTVWVPRDDDKFIRAPRAAGPRKGREGK
jgi:hypothetical protein